MQKIIEFYNSSVGRKLTIGLTGILLAGYLIIHLFGNLLLFRNDAGTAFNNYAEILPQIVFIRIIEVLLFLIFLFHIITAANTWLINKQVGGKKYIKWNKNETSPLSSRTMFLTGSIVFIFLVIHMRQFWYNSRYESGSHYSMYNVVKATFSDPVYGIFYLIAIFLLGFHLRHGFQSAFQTFGLKNNRYASLIEWLGLIFWLLIPLGFASMPIYFLLQF